MTRLSMLLILVVATPGAAVAQDMFPDVEYISGKSGFDRKVKGSLLLGDTELAFVTEHGKPIFRIALATVTEIGGQADIRDASAGKKLLLGGLAGTRKQEFVSVSTETADEAEGIVFKVKQNVSTGLVAKVKFAVKKLTSAKSASDSARSTPSTIEPMETQ